MITLTFGMKLAHVRTDRAAVIPYVIKDGKIYFLLAIDAGSGDFTDFGGGVKQYEQSLGAALREFKEETGGVFGDLYDNPNLFSTNIALLNRYMCTMFVPLPEEWLEKTRATFLEIHKLCPNAEVSDVMWLDEEEFRRLLSHQDKRLWYRLQKFYREGYSEHLRQALQLSYR